MKRILLAITIISTFITAGNLWAKDIPDFAKDNYSVSVWIKTSQDGPIFAKTLKKGQWVAGGKSLFISKGAVKFDIGWGGGFNGRTKVNDNKWHHILFTGSKPQKIYVDGKLDGTANIDPKPDPDNSVFKIGTISDNWPLGGRGFSGSIKDVRIYNNILSENEIKGILAGKPSNANLAAHWPKTLSLERYMKGERKAKEGKFDAETAASISKQFGFNKLLFVKRRTFDANHYYTEFINSNWRPGGNLCVLDLKTGKLSELVPELQGGVFGRFDLDFDAKHIVFAWKSAHQQGNRLYEIQIDPETGKRKGELKQLTFPQKSEEKLVKMYRAHPEYHHGTDDMDPCYLPDGDIVFISTRCQYGILCDGPDNFTTTVLYRMKRNASLESRQAGTQMTKLSNSSVSESSPAILPDGRIMYTRWEYVEKGAVSVKCLWAMKPDGTGSLEIYGNNVSLPPTMLYGRPIPNKPSHYVMLGTPHYPQNGMGTVIRLDMTKNIRTREPMTYMSPDVDIRSQGGFHFKKGNRWRQDESGRAGRLFKEPYPLSSKLFLVPFKAAGVDWRDFRGYDIALLDETGASKVIYANPEMSCFLPFPLKARKRPPVTQTDINKETAKQGLATCVVTDIYHGMEDTERGSIKYIRVLEQIPRPWATRRHWGGDGYDQQHATITKNTHLGLRVQHGVVPVEDDGSAHFLVPAGKNIYFQALDENYMAVQTERTLINYMPGETRSCIGCHETPNEAATARTKSAVKALKRKASMPGPQPGEKSGRRALDYATDVQPVWDKHCIKCHGGKEPKKNLNLEGTMTPLFSLSYEQLIENRRGGAGRRGPLLCGPTIGENHPKTGNVHYMPARSFGSHASVLVAMLSKGKVKLKDPKQAALAEKLIKEHEKIKLTKEELIRVTNWVDTNAQFYGMYWGRKNIKYKNHPNFRPTPTFKRAASYVSQIPEEER